MYDDLPDIALSVRQPWPWAMFHADKDIENRDWSTKRRGPVCIHAGQGMTLADYTACFRTWMAIGRERDFPEAGMTFPGADDLARGGIVGVVDIVDCVRRSDSPWFFGEFGFVLANACPVPLIPVKGALGFFKWKGRVQ